MSVSPPTSSGIEPPLLSADLLNEAVLRCPHAFNQWLHEQPDVFRDADTGVVVVSRYADARRILTDPATFSSAATIDVTRATLSAEKLAREQAVFASEGWVPTPTLSLMDNPRHAEIRALFVTAFRPARIQLIKPTAEHLAAALVDAFAADGHADLLAQFCAPFPLQLICGQLGVAPTDVDKIKAWTDAWTRRFSMGQSDAEDLACVREEIAFQHYFVDLVAARRRQPDATILSDLINLRLSDGSTLTYAEITSHLLSDLLVGGAETTTNALAEGILQWCRQPELVTALAAGDDLLLANFVEEILRLSAPVQGLFRVATRDCTVGAYAIPAGTLLQVRFAAANRDPHKFTSPAKLDPGRAHRGAHLAFGSGIHHCVGAPLARLELHVGFRALLSCLGDFSLDIAESDLDYRPSLALRALEALPVRFTPRPDA